MTDKLDLTTPYLDAVLHALIDPERTDFEIRHLDLGRARSVWLADLRREIAGLSARALAELDQIRALCVAAGWEDEGSTLGLVTGVVDLLTLTTRSKSPCGHWAAHAYSPDGKGKQIKCLDCEAAVLTVRAACADQPWQPIAIYSLLKDMRRCQQENEKQAEMSREYVRQHVSENLNRDIERRHEVVAEAFKLCADSLEALLPAPPSPAAKETK